MLSKMTDSLNNNDLHDLTSAPWDFDQHDQRDADTVYCAVTGPDGKVLFDTCNSEAMLIHNDSDEDGPHYYDSVGKANLRFCMIARNVFAILMEYGWSLQKRLLWGDPARKDHKAWVVCESRSTGDGPIVGPRGKDLVWANDPFSVVLKAKAWQAAKEREQEAIIDAEK